MKRFTILNKFLAITLAVSTMAITSCKKEDIDNTPVTKTYKLIKYQENDNLYIAFDYNAAGLVTKVSNVSAGQNHAYNVTYNSSNKPLTATASDQVIKYNYVNSQLDKVDMFLGTSTVNPDAYVKLNYNNGRISDATMYSGVLSPTNPLPFLKYTYDYYANGDVKTQTEYSWDVIKNQFVLSETHSFEYDDKHNPFIPLNDLYEVTVQLPSIHNLTKLSNYDKDGKLLTTTTYTYIYNSDGYPTQADQKVASVGGFPTVDHYQYTYQ